MVNGEWGENYEHSPKIELLLSILRHTLSSLNVWEGRRRLSHKNSEKKKGESKVVLLMENDHLV